MRLKIFPITRSAANELVRKLHRHHKPVVGYRFAIGLMEGERICGAAIIGRPTGRKNPQYAWCEVTRCVTDGTKNACSKLYAAAARIAKEMGFIRIQTFILEDEKGISLTAAGWEFDCFSDGGDWNQPSQGERLRLDLGDGVGASGRRTDQPQGRKQRWKKDLNPS